MGDYHVVVLTYHDSVIFIPMNPLININIVNFQQSKDQYPHSLLALPPNKEAVKYEWTTRTNRDGNGCPQVRVSHYPNPHPKLPPEPKPKGYSGGKITLAPTPVGFGFFNPNPNP
jgi:hypothetical protein